MNFKFGSDPEFMLVDLRGNYKSAIEVVRGTKEDKANLGNGHNAFYDNVLAEVNIRPEAGLAAVLDSFQDCFRRLSQHIGPKYKLRPQASHKYPAKECEHRDAKVFGCDPEFDAYELAPNQPPECKDTFRSGGGHIHLGRPGWEKYCPNLAEAEGREPEDGSNLLLIDPWSKVNVVRMLDLFLGVTSLYIDHDPTSAARRRLYGKAGSHRPTSYGVEYRSLSNFWLASPRLVEFMYETCSHVLSLMEPYDGKPEQESNPAFGDVDVSLMREVINTGDKKKAKPLFDVVMSRVPDKIGSMVKELSKPHSYDFYKEWGL